MTTIDNRDGTMPHRLQRLTPCWIAFFDAALAIADRLEAEEAAEQTTLDSKENHNSKRDGEAD